MAVTLTLGDHKSPGCDFFKKIPCHEIEKYVLNLICKYEVKRRRTFGAIFRTVFAQNKTQNVQFRIAIILVFSSSIFLSKVYI